MLDTVDDLILLIAENNIAVFSHELDDQKFTALITHFIQMLNLKTENTLHGRLSPVSYTHLDVYKRQGVYCLRFLYIHLSGKTSADAAVQADKSRDHGG